MLDTPAGRLFPRHEGSVDHIRHTLAADRSDGKVDVSQSKRVGRDLFQRKTLRRKLLQGQFARLEAVTAGALDGNELQRDAAKREIRELRQLSLDHHRSALALERLHPKQYRLSAGAGGAV